MLHKTMIVLLTAAALTAGLTADAFARGGGGGGGGHGGGFGGGGHMGGGFGGGVIWAGGSAALAWAAALVAVIWAAGSAVAVIWAAALAEAISPAVAWLSVAALRVCMPRRAATSAAITFVVADASGSVAAMTTGATSTPITHRTAICMGTDVPRRPAYDAPHKKQACIVFAGPVATTAIRDFGLLRKGEG